MNRILDSFRAGRKDVAEFWINMRGRFIHIRYFAVRDGAGKYRGCLEVTQDIGAIRALEGERREAGEGSTEREEPMIRSKTKAVLLFMLTLLFGVFGFLINPPIVLYYIQGINTTPIHAHTALFGVYGLLAISLMLFSMRHIVKLSAWSDRLLKWSFWGMNGGLLLMTLVSLVPSGFYQFYFAVRDGMWYARSPEIASGEVVRTLAKVRIVPDLIFASGAILILAFVVRAVLLTVRKSEGGR